MMNAPRSVTAETLAERIAATLRVLLAERRNGVKHLARRIAADFRAVENWQGGRCAPRSAELIRLMAAEPAIKAEVLRMVADEEQAMRAVALAARQQERRLLGARIDHYDDLLGEADAADSMGAGESLGLGGARV